MTIIISSRSLNEIESISAWIGIITNGNIVKEIPLKDIQKDFPNGLKEYFFEITKGGKTDEVFN